ncbi:MAG: hypothetical protein LBM07_02455 [Culturomica sp.]|jgi:hypothetical protein|nr:hypothetical protein [Culturomica sp.]
MKRIKHYFFPILIVLAVLYGCLKDENEHFASGKQERTERVQDWFVDLCGDFVRVKDGKGEFLPLGLFPNWETQRSSSKGSTVAMEYNLNGLLSYRTRSMNEIATMQTENDSSDDTTFVLYSSTRLVVLENDTSDGFLGFLMTIIPSRSYFENYGAELEDFTYFDRPADFDGTVLYHDLGGNFVNGWKYVEGNVLYTADILQCDTVLESSITPASTTCYTEFIDVDVWISWNTIEHDPMYGKVVVANTMRAGAVMMAKYCTESGGGGGGGPYLPSGGGGGHYDPPPYQRDTLVPPVDNPIDPASITEAAEYAVQYVINHPDCGTKKKCCNKGVNAMFKQLFNSDELEGMFANNMISHWDSTAHWVTVNSLEEAQQLANEGHFVVAGRKEKGNGHVVVVVPGEMVSSGNWGGRVPVVMDTGENRRYTKKGVGYSWTEKGGVKFYKYINFLSHE